MTRQTLLLFVAYLGFVSLGLPDPVVGVAWPSVRQTFQLSQSDFGFIFIGLSTGYCLSSFFGGTLSRMLGVGWLLTLSSLLVALSMFASAMSPMWGLFLAAAVIWGLGSGAIDTGLNVFVSRHFSPRHINWLHACYSLGATLGPLVMTSILVRYSNWRPGYLVIGGILLLMTVIFLLTHRHWGVPEDGAQDKSTPTVGIWETLLRPVVWFQIVIFLLYTGLEFTMGQWAYTIMTESRHIPLELAGTLTGCYYGAIGVGRLLTGIVTERIGLDQLIRMSLLLTVLGAVLFACSSSLVFSAAGLLLAGLGLAPVFPCMMARTPQRLGHEGTAHAVGFQVSAAMFGAAALPAMAGLIASKIGLQAVAVFSLVVAVLMAGVHEWLLRWSRPAVQ